MIVRRIQEWSRSQPSRAAVVRNGATFDYASFIAAIDRAYSRLHPLGLRPGDLAVVRIYDLYEASLQVIALRARGMTTIAVTSIEQAASLGLKNVSLVVAHEGEMQLAPLDQRIPSSARLAVMPDAAWGEIASGPCAADDPAPFGGHILYTSGTTGAYKMVLERGAIEDGRNAIRAASQGLSANTVQHNLNLGLWTSAGFKFPGSVWHAGGCIVLDQRRASNDHLLEHGVNRIFALPASLPGILAALDADALADPELEVVVSGGFLSADIAMAVKQRLAGKLLAYFNSTELAINVLESVVATEEDLIWMRPGPGRVVEIVDDAGRLCAPNIPGELRVLRTPTDSEGYIDDPEATARMYRDGYFYPGDLAVQRADGRVRILGRIADVLNVKGQKLPAAPIEQEIRRILQAAEVCVFAGLNSAGRETVVVAVEADQTPAQAARDTVARSLRMFEAVHFAVVPAFPRTETGMRKIKRLALRQMVWDAVENQANIA